ncbi:hypothetical protein OHA74_20735 [Streptomyces phaeochromogenes]|uniref:hypothetical protein n=1 Tax=Streptomyces phaeochromogenes TaxID=1923 RepID=UPI002E29CDD1|nr:hypothetical protein [Streptomyces phaeochromogenes]
MNEEVTNLDDVEVSDEVTSADDAEAVEKEVVAKPVKAQIKGQVFEFPHIATWKPGAMYALRKAANKPDDADSLFSVIDALSYVLDEDTFKRLMSLEWEDLGKVLAFVFKQFGLSQGE